MQHGGPQLKEKKTHTHTHTHTYGSNMNSSSTQRGSRSGAAAALDPGVNTVVGSVSSSCRCGLAAFTGDRSTDSDDGGVER